MTSHRRHYVALRYDVMCLLENWLPLPPPPQYSKPSYAYVLVNLTTCFFLCMGSSYFEHCETWLDLHFPESVFIYRKEHFLMSWLK